MYNFDDDLFITPLELEKEASDEVILEDPSNWEHKITKQIYEKIPFVSRYNTVLQFHKRDDKRGFAYGTLAVDNSINIPIIIKQKQGKTILEPMDIFNYNGKWYPLTQDRIERLLFNHQIFDRIAKPQEEVKGYNEFLSEATQPPSDGREVLASLGNVLDAILPYADRKDLQNTINEVDGNPKIAAGFKLNGTFDRIRKIAEESSKQDKIASDISALETVNIVQIEKQASGYNATFISDRLYAPKNIEINAVKIRDTFGNDVLKEASTNGVAIVELNRQPSSVYILNDVVGVPDNIEKDGAYEINLSIDKVAKGYVFTNVIDFDLNKINRSIFTDGEVYAYQDKLAGLEADIPVNGIVKSAAIKDKIVGSFIFEKDGIDERIATIPVKLASVAIKDESGLKLQAEDLWGQRLSLIVTPEVKTITKFANGYYIPSWAKFIKLGKRIEALSDVNHLQKIAELNYVDDNFLDITWTGLQYTIDGMDEADYFDSKYGLDKVAAKHMLVAMGASPEKADILLKRAQKEHKIKAGGFKNLLIPGVTKLAQYSKYKKAIQDIKIDTLKIAALLPEETVDSVLSLKFINPQNIQVFMNYIPVFEETVSHLASLLVAARIGLEELDANAVKEAMIMLEDIIQKLKNMFGVQNALQNLEGQV